MRPRPLLTTATALVLVALMGSSVDAASKKLSSKSASKKAIATLTTGVNRAGANEVRLSAFLGGGDGPQAKSSYRERVRNGSLEVRWKVELEDFAAGVDVPVSINGNLVGTIIPDALGAGVIQFRTFVDDPGDGNPLPEGFPRLHAGDTVTVGTFTATYN